MSKLPSKVSGASFDALLAIAIAVFSLMLSALSPDGRGLDALGVVLLVVANVAIAWRRARPGMVLLVVIAVTVPYHALDYRHEAAVPAALLALATFSSRVERTKGLLLGLAVAVVALVVMTYTREGSVDPDHLGAVGWILFAAAAGQAWRGHDQYVTSIIDRAERAERTREEEARRRVAEERVRIARDLHDLLAHSITLIGVQAGVAAHLARQPEPDGKVLAEALETIADGCRTARAEVRATLTVLREEGESGEQGAVPGLAALDDLAASVRGTGLDVAVRVDADAAEAVDRAPALGVAAYRIVQEALTNVVRHAAAARVAVRAEHDAGVVTLTIADDGRGAVPASREPADGPGGFGILGMAERARSVGGRLTAGPGESGGFTVCAVLPLPDAPGLNSAAAPGGP
jgi:signal transduction histidine kinase